ncbi:MAG TPA: hypothetical protein VNH84_10840 [Candidatus Saccharimonadales bacterium]|nr:hypothetical protein [Candidatus Saccharimonadales bacterium]
MSDDFVSALMHLRPQNLPSGQAKGRLSKSGKKGPKGKKVAPKHGKTKHPTKARHGGGPTY